jgi:hypothetical protein
VMSITALLSCAAVTLGLGLVAYRLFGTRSARRDLAREWQRSKLGMLSLGAGFVSMLFFFTAMLVPKIWHATRPVPLTAFGLALVCSAALVWQDGRPSTPGTATKTPRPRDEAPGHHRPRRWRARPARRNALHVPARPLRTAL